MVVYIVTPRPSYFVAPASSVWLHYIRATLSIMATRALPEVRLPSQTSSSARSIQQSKRRTLHLPVSKASYRLAWGLVLFFHVSHGGLLARATYSLVNTIRKPLRTTSYLRAVGVNFDLSLPYLSATAALMLICFHLHQIWHLVRGSIIARKLKLIPYELSQPPPPIPEGRATVLHHARRFVRTFNWYCGTCGPYFEESYHAREALEILLQSIQGYRISYFVADAWTNQLAVFVIVLNSWSSPVLYWIYHNHQAKRRISCLMVDVVLDFTSSLVVPFAIYARYRELLHSGDIYDPVWVHQVANSVQQFTATSLFDILFRSSSMVTMLLSLQTIQAIVRRSPTASSRSIVPTTTAPAPASTNSTPAAGDPPRTQFTAVNKSTRKRWLAFVHIVSVGYGILILLVFHFASTRVRDNSRDVPGCRLALRKWFSTKHPCAVLEINCYMRDLSGSAEELAASLSVVDRSALGALTIAHCPSVAMPPSVTNFPNLVWLEVYNSTLVEWSLSARLTRSSSQRLSRLLLIHVNLSCPESEFPDGLMPSSRDSSPALRQIVFVDTNLSSFPEDLSERWSPSQVETIIIEDCGLTEVPAQLASLHPTRFSLAGNAISSIPSWMLTPSVPYIALSIADNPISSLPSIHSSSSTFKHLVASSAHFKGLHIEATGLTQLPQWMVDVGVCSSVDLFAFDSPLCDGRLTSTSCEFSATHCHRSDVPRRSVGRLFPIDVHEARRRVNPVDDVDIGIDCGLPGGSY